MAPGYRRREADLLVTPRLSEWLAVMMPTNSYSEQEVDKAGVIFDVVALPPVTPL